MVLTCSTLTVFGETAVAVGYSYLYSVNNAQTVWLTKVVFGCNRLALCVTVEFRLVFDLKFLSSCF